VVYREVLPYLAARELMVVAATCRPAHQLVWTWRGWHGHFIALVGAPTVTAASLAPRDGGLRRRAVLDGVSSGSSTTADAASTANTGAGVAPPAPLPVPIATPTTPPSSPTSPAAVVGALQSLLPSAPVTTVTASSADALFTNVPSAQHSASHSLVRAGSASETHVSAATSPAPDHDGSVGGGGGPQRLLPLPESAAEASQQAAYVKKHREAFMLAFGAVAGRPVTLELDVAIAAEAQIVTPQEKRSRVVRPSLESVAAETKDEPAPVLVDVDAVKNDPLVAAILRTFEGARIVKVE